MAKGEFEGLKALHAIIPSNTPQPIAHGTYAKDPNRHFFLCDFHEMKDDMSSTERSVAAAAELHEKSDSLVANSSSIALRMQETTPCRLRGVSPGRSSSRGSYARKLSRRKVFRNRMMRWMSFSLFCLIK